MKVDTEHADYSAMSERWKRCRDAAEGLDACRKARTAYLPTLSGQDNTEYNAYLKRADLYGAMGRSIQGHAGGVFRKPVKIEVPAAGEEWLDDITLTGITLQGLMLSAIQGLLEVGRYGLFVDMATKKEGEVQRPYFILIPAENVVSWKTENRGGKQVLTRVVLRELVTEEGPEDPFVLVETEQFRVLEMPGTEDYVQTVYRKAKGTDDFEVWETVIPDRRGKAFDQIPFWFGNASSITPQIEKPPLMEVADLVLSMWRNSADLENGFHYVGIPTPWIAGFPTKTRLKIGSNVAWVSDKSDAKVGMLEFTGQGLSGLSDHIDGKKRDCAVFGSRLLEEQKKAAETAETVRLRHAGEVASLMSMVDTLDATFGEALKFAFMWAGVTGDVTLTTNRDLLSIKATPQELQALTKALQDGAISYATYYHNLEQLELTRPEVDHEAELEDIENDGNREVVLSVSGGREADDNEEARALKLAEDVAA